MAPPESQENDGQLISAPRVLHARAVEPGSENGSAALRPAVITPTPRAAATLLQEFVAASCALGILRHDLLKEQGDVVETGIFRIANVLTVVVSGFERVVLNRDQVEADIIESGFPVAISTSLKGARVVRASRTPHLSRYTSAFDEVHAMAL